MSALDPKLIPLILGGPPQARGKVFYVIVSCLLFMSLNPTLALQTLTGPVQARGKSVFKFYKINVHAHFVIFCMFIQFHTLHQNFTIRCCMVPQNKSKQTRFKTPYKARIMLPLRHEKYSPTSQEIKTPYEVGIMLLLRHEKYSLRGKK